MTKQERSDNSEDVWSEELCIRIRKRLKLTEEQLPSKTIKKMTTLSNKLTGDWIVNNADGFTPYKNAGTLIVSKFMPKSAMEDKYERIEQIENDTTISAWLKKRVLGRYNKRKVKYKNESPMLHWETFFYRFKIMWFNRGNCDFKKATIYDFHPTKAITDKLSEKVKEGKDYFSWNFSDFRVRKVKKVRKNKDE